MNQALEYMVAKAPDRETGLYLCDSRTYADERMLKNTKQHKLNTNPHTRDIVNNIKSGLWRAARTRTLLRNLSEPGNIHLLLCTCNSFSSALAMTFVTLLLRRYTPKNADTNPGRGRLQRGSYPQVQAFIESNHLRGIQNFHVRMPHLDENFFETMTLRSKYRNVEYLNVHVSSWTHATPTQV